MNIDILNPDYGHEFNDKNYQAPIPMLLKGLAAAIQDSHPSWRPKISELVALLPESKESNKLVLAGSAYGAAKAIKDVFPGPAILLFGAAVNAIGQGHEPQVELKTHIDSAEKKLTSNLLINDSDIKEVLKAAKDRARFDKVSEMLRKEFSAGLKKTGKYNEQEIDKAVKEIVDVTHEVRHKGLIDRFKWGCIDSGSCSIDATIPIPQSSTDVSFLHQQNKIVFDDSELRKLIPYAQKGCAYSILNRMGTHKQKSS